MLKLTFYGGVEGEVTGSNYVLEYQSPDSKKISRLMIDCGLTQGGSQTDKRNFEPFPYDITSIDAVLITHAHIDHIGRLPKLAKDGYKKPIYSTGPTKDTAEQLLIDAEHLLRKEAEEKNIAPLFGLDDINNCLKLWRKIGYHEKFSINDFTIEFFDAGHILGSAFIKVSAPEPENKTIVFSGDLGNTPVPLVKDTEKLPSTDYLVIESTYGNRVHENPLERKNRLEDIIENAVEANGTLLIPAFAMERTQEILYELNDLAEHKRIPPISIFVDSPLAIKLTGIYQKYYQDPDYMDGETIALAKKGNEIFNFPRLKFTLTTEASKEINGAPPPKIIIAGSGMSHGGRILHHELRYLPDQRNTLLFIGYQSAGTLGRKILDGAQSVRIFGETIPVRCRIERISGYSAHADQPLLLKWVAGAKDSLKNVFVVQGEREEAASLAGKISDEFAVKTTLPRQKESFVL